MDERKSGKKEFQEGLGESSQNDYQRQKEAAKKAMLVANDFNSSDDTTCGERIASFLVSADLTNKDGDSKHKEAFHPSRPILWTKGKYKSRDGKSQSSQIKPFYSDMVVRRTGNDLPKSDGSLAQKTKIQRSTLHHCSITNNTDPSREVYIVEKKKAVSHKRCFESYDASTSKDEKHNANFSCSDRVSIPRMRSEKEDISSVDKKRTKDLEATSSEDWKDRQEENTEKSLNFRATTVPKKERLTVAESKKKTISGSKIVEKECKDSERDHQVNEGNRKSAKLRGAAKDPGGKKMAKTTMVIDKDELKSKSENHVSFSFTGHLPGRIPGTYSLIDIEKLKQKHSRCCRECLEARARSAAPFRKGDKEEQAKKMITGRPTAPVVAVDRASSPEEQLENSIVFFRNALNAVDLLEKLFQNIGSTKEFLQNVYDGLEESNDVARCRRNMTQAREGDEGPIQPKDIPKDDRKEKVTNENHEVENKKVVGKPKKKFHSRIRFKNNGATGQSSDMTSLKQDQKSKPKRDRDKNLLELSDEWKKRNHNAKP
ncbi:uncharacterized protein LOC116292377 [Actinia tenebrosa]|uniref:Uncharacterized protein LOC116292377 n=1 Tax=Actinia tenebrosa TaxID=6105 RepID=A0A6P8HI52_ACTTE|nr:uncharacterized protein LOC116292377 [Actinia tenebrosa]